MTFWTRLAALAGLCLLALQARADILGWSYSGTASGDTFSEPVPPFYYPGGFQGYFWNAQGPVFGVSSPVNTNEVGATASFVYSTFGYLDSVLTSFTGGVELLTQAQNSDAYSEAMNGYASASVDSAFVTSSLSFYIDTPYFFELMGSSSAPEFMSAELNFEGLPGAPRFSGAFSQSGILPAGAYTLFAYTSGNALPAQLAGASAQNLLSVNYSLTLAPVPVPAAAWLLLSGLGGLGVFARRRS